MKKIILASCIAILSACSGPSLGVIPKTKEKNPDTISKYIEQGAFYDSSKKEKLDYSQFAQKKCNEIGKKNYEAYKYGYLSGVFIGVSPIMFPFTDVSRDVKIWCK